MVRAEDSGYVPDTYSMFQPNQLVLQSNVTLQVLLTCSPWLYDVEPLNEFCSELPVFTKAKCFRSNLLTIHPSWLDPTDKQTILHSLWHNSFLVAFILLRSEENTSIIFTNNPFLKQNWLQMSDYCTHCYWTITEYLIKLSANLLIHLPSLHQFIPIVSAMFNSS